MATVQHKGGSGCLGCLGKTAVMLLLAVVLLLLIDAVFAPWGFFLGGKFHVIPYWQGWGRLHSKISGDYLLFVEFEPSPHGRYGTYVTGRGYICTPRGEQLPLSIGGGMRRHLSLSTDGEAIHLWMHYRPWYATFYGDNRPLLRFDGKWRNPNLALNDDGVISYAFLPDGSVYRGNNPNRPYPEKIDFTLWPGSYADFKSTCASLPLTARSH
jgi:hypothetical protein